MKKYRVTYLPFPQSDAEASDVILYAVDEARCPDPVRAAVPGMVV